MRPVPPRRRRPFSFLFTFAHPRRPFSCFSPSPTTGLAHARKTGRSAGPTAVREYLPPFTCRCRRRRRVSAAFSVAYAPAESVVHRRRHQRPTVVRSFNARHFRFCLETCRRPISRDTTTATTTTEDERVRGLLFRSASSRRSPSPASSTGPKHLIGRPAADFRRYVPIVGCYSEFVHIFEIFTW